MVMKILNTLQVKYLNFLDKDLKFGNYFFFRKGYNPEIIKINVEYNQNAILVFSTTTVNHT